MIRLSLMLSTACMLAACNSGGGNEQALNALDTKLAGNEVDPALASSLQDQIMVDPSLGAQANGDSIRPAGQPAQAPLPADAVPGAPANAAVTAAAGGALIRVPAPVSAADHKPYLTLGGLAAQQGRKRGQNCNARLSYTMDWAQKLPADMPLFPKARVAEAAGVDGDCTRRVVTFTTGAPLQEVLDFYYTRGVRSGYAASHEADGGEHMVGGTRARDDSAYVAMIRALPGGGTEVDLVSDIGG